MGSLLNTAITEIISKIMMLEVCLVPSRVVLLNDVLNKVLT